jgi:DNA primase
MGRRRNANIYTSGRREAGLRISQRSIEDVREAADIVEIASEFTALRRQGARLSGLCPYPDHQEKDPLLQRHPGQGLLLLFRL